MTSGAKEGSSAAGSSSSGSSRSKRVADKNTSINNKGKKKVSLYELIKVSRDATAKEIKRAYYALARVVHPDKCPDDPEGARTRFQALQRAYAILSDPKKRERYDRTGCDDDENEAFWDAYERFRGIKVTVDDIEKYVETYKGSDDEKADVIDFFQSHKGNIENILGFIIGATEADIDRYVSIIDDAIAEKSYPEAYVEAFGRTRGSVISLADLDALEEANGEDVRNDDDEDADDGGEEEDDGGDLDGFIVNDDDATSNADGLPRKAKYDSDEEDEDDLLRVGDTVHAKWNGGQTWYLGVVESVEESRMGPRYAVKFHDDGSTESDLARRHVHFCCRGGGEENASVANVDDRKAPAKNASARKNKRTRAPATQSKRSESRERKLRMTESPSLFALPYLEIKRNAEFQRLSGLACCKVCLAQQTLPYLRVHFFYIAINYRHHQNESARVACMHVVFYVYFSLYICIQNIYSS